jgi:glycosyltransferase involved in cell wall biosynthesis
MIEVSPIQPSSADRVPGKFAFGRAIRGFEKTSQMRQPITDSLHILAASWGLPRPDTNAADRRFVALLRLMSLRHRVDFCCGSTPCDGEEADRLRQTVARLSAMGVKVVSPCVGSFDRYWLERALTGSTYDLVFFEYWQAAADGRAAKVRAAQPWARIVVDSVDVHFVREQAEVELDHRQRVNRERAEANKRGELAAYCEGDAVVVISREDQEVLAAYPGMPPLYRLPIIIPPRPRPERHRDSEVLFIGGFNHAPNIDGIVWFTHAIWPQVRSAAPSARLTIVGASPTEEIRALGDVAGVDVVGYVPETDPYLDRAAVVIAPLRFGAGMKGKVSEALACGAPVVSTTIGAQGFGAIAGEDLLVADEPDDFARQVASLLNDPARAQRIGQSGHDRLASLCAPESVGLEMERMFAEVAKPSRPTVSQQARSWAFAGRLAAARAARWPLLFPPVRAVRDRLRSKPEISAGGRP